MNNQWKRVAVMLGIGAVLALSGNNAFALGRSHKSGVRGWSQSSTGSGNIVNNNQDTPNNPSNPVQDSNPVPEPASLVLFGSALAGLGGYRGLRKRLARR